MATTTGFDSPDSSTRERKLSVVDARNGNILEMSELGANDQQLAQFGYKPVFKREFGFFACLSFATSISACFATIVTTFSYTLYSGGAPSAVWCWLISGAGCMCIAASVSELVSAYPTSGGLYFTVSRLVHPDWVASISWIDGWLNLLGQIAGVASVEWGAAAILLAAVSIGSNGTYVPTNAHTVGVQAALTIFAGLVNSLNTSWLAKITTSYVVFHGLVIITCSIALLAMCPDKHSASYVFTMEGFVDQSGWSPAGWSFLFGFLSVSWTMTDYDATAHIAEEIDEPEKKAPWAIFIAMALTYVVGWLFTLVLAFTMGDPVEVLASPLYQPVVQIFYNNLGKTGGIVFAVCAFVILNTCAITALQSTARTVFAFSRDRMLPGSHIWTKVNKTTGTPIYAVWLMVFFCAAINLIALGSYITISAIFNVCAIALDWSYCIPIICKLVGNRFQPGPWHMGKAGFWVNLYAVSWTAFVSIIFLCPTVVPVAADTMNYAVVILGAIVIFSSGYYLARGHKYYIGPLAETEVLDGHSTHKEKEAAADESIVH